MVSRHFFNKRHTHLSSRLSISVMRIECDILFVNNNHNFTNYASIMCAYKSKNAAIYFLSYSKCQNVVFNWPN